MSDRTIHRVATSIVDPTLDHHFSGTLAEATDEMVRYAGQEKERLGGGATKAISARLARAQHDRVADVCAVALLRLAEIEAELARYHVLHDRLDEAVRDAGEVMDADAVVECIGTTNLPVRWPAVHAGYIRRQLAKVNGQRIDRRTEDQ